MSIKDLKTYLRVLETQGWRVMIGGSGHYKLRTPSGQLFTCSATPSCPNAHKQLQRDIRRYIKDPKEIPVFNSPRIVVDKEKEEKVVRIVQPQTLAPNPEKKEIKKLDKDALDFCIMAKQDKWNQTKISEALTQMGYTGNRGGKIAQTDVSEFMTKNGIRQLTRGNSIPSGKGRGNKVTDVPKEKQTVEIDPKQVAKPAKKEKPKEEFKSDLLDDVREILDSPISEKLKDKLLKGLLK